MKTRSIIRPILTTLTIQSLITVIGLQSGVCSNAVAQTITHVPQFIVDGDSGDNRFGRSVKGAGDVNGDGFDDFIVGADLADKNGFSSGSARVFSGSDSSLLYEFNGDSTQDYFGASVSGAGDVNGDGFADVIVGAPGDDNNGTSSGSARVHSGVDGSILYIFNGDSARDFFGESVSGTGDVNGDGFDDLIVGASGDDNNGFSSGSARVFSGVDGSVLFTFNGNSSDFFGNAVSDAGDVNGDGFADLIVRAAPDPNLRLAYARVFSGVDGRVLYNFFVDSGANRDGEQVSGAGDVNNDGFDDLIVGSHTDDTNGIDSGNARVFSGADGSLLYNFHGDSSSDFFGRSVSGVGDVNVDGFDDFIVGADNAAGGGSARVYSGNNGEILYDFTGVTTRDRCGAPDRFGASVSGVGDVNGDGVPDFIVGAENGGKASLDAGDVRLFVSGSPVLGDFDLDGDVDLGDLDRYIGTIEEPASGDLELLDLNGDGTVGANDFEQHYETLVETSNGGKGTFAGDANLDGTVNVLGDAFRLVGNLGSSVTSWAGGDFNGDGTVNVLGDAFALIANLGRRNDAP